MKKWKILKWKNKPQTTMSVAFTCTKCMTESMLAIKKSIPLAQVGDGIVFDSFPEAGIMPTIMQCPHCKIKLEEDK